MRFLVSNDDSIHAEGLLRLEAELAALGEVYVVAPDREQSGMGHSITLYRPLRAREVGERRWAVDGTPTDCINLALHHLLRGTAIDLVVSGVNAGLNLGDDVTYSGTVGAAIEAHLLGVPAMAFSQDTGGEFSMPQSARWAAQLVAGVVGTKPDRRLLLSVNFPSGRPRGIKLTRLGRRFYREVVVEKTDPRGSLYYWIGGTPDWEGGEGTDHDALQRKLVSVTPLHIDLTDFRALERAEPWRSQVESLSLESGEAEPR